MSCPKCGDDMYIGQAEPGQVIWVCCGCEGWFVIVDAGDEELGPAVDEALRSL